MASVPDSNSPALHLSHPTHDECITIWTNTSASWRDALTISEYLEESQFLTNVPLAQGGGMATWILVGKHLSLNHRPILCSCETFRKRALTSDAYGNVSEGVVYGVASVFCPQEYRGHGYAPRMMRELAKQLHGWQTGEMRCIGSILYSDIGKSYYGKLGWHPNPNNSEIVFQASSTQENNNSSRPVCIEDLETLCQRDEAMLRTSMAVPAEGVPLQIAIVPDLDHMLWHISKEEFACQRLFGKIPVAKGAIAGSPGSRVWVIWTHRYYRHPGSATRENTLYILRLVFETKFSGHSYTVEQAASLKVVLQAAQAEAEEWNLAQVKMWNPSAAVLDMVGKSGVEYMVSEREEEGIASGLWYGEDGKVTLAPRWVGCEYYTWC